MTTTIPELTAVSGGTHTYSKTRFPLRLRAVRGDGCYLTCDDGRRYVDTVAGLGAVSLGYRDPGVDDAIRQQMGAGISFSLPTALEEFAARELLAFLGRTPASSRVRFSKNGADVTNLAVRLARAHTGRQGIVALDYHGHDDWCQIRSPDQHGGIPGALGHLVDDCIVFENGDKYPETGRQYWRGDEPPAAVILEPIPSDGSRRSINDLTRIATWARQWGALVIYDCMVTGLRLNRDGWPGQAPTPDLACYGKGMANGMPLAALVGPAEIMDRVLSDVFFSTTFGGEALSLAAMRAVLTRYRALDLVDGGAPLLHNIGVRLIETLTERAARYHLQDQLEIVGYTARPFHRWREPRQAERFTRGMLEAGVLYQGYHNLMAATADPDALTTIEAAYDYALGMVNSL